MTIINERRRRFVKFMGQGFVIVGAGLVGIPLGCRTQAGGDPADLLVGPDGRPIDIDSLPDMSPAEIREFQDRIDEGLAGLDSRSSDTAGDASQHSDLNDDYSDASEPDQDAGKLKIPPGQTVVEGIPVLGQNPSPRSLEEWRFYVQGEVITELEFNWNDFNELNFIDQISDLHCVTGWTVLNTQWRGIRVKDLLEMAGLTPKSNFIVFDCEQGYTTSIPLSEAQKDNVLIGTELYGEPLPQKYGGPARGLVPDKYLYKSGKWVTGLRILETDELGFWESNGYSNTADPWTQDRYA